MKRMCSSAILLSVLLACYCLSWAETAKELHAKGEEAIRPRIMKRRWNTTLKL